MPTPKTILLLLAISVVLAGLSATANARPIESYSPELKVTLQSDFLWRYVRDVDCQNELVYLLMVNGLQVYDGGVDFVSPELVSQLSLEYPYVDFSIRGETASLLTRQGLMTFADISDPRSMSTLGSVKLADTVFDYVSTGAVGYAACGFYGIYVVDQSDLSDPQVSIVHEEGVHMTSVAVVGDFLYAGDDYNGMLIYSLEDPLEPYLFDVILYPRQVKDIAIANDELYVAYGDSGVVSYSIGIPGNLIRDREYPTETAAVGVKLLDGVLFAEDILGDIYVFDIDSDSVRLMIPEQDISGHYDFQSRNGRDYLYLPDKSGGFEILSIDKDVEPEQVWLYPGSELVSSVSLFDSLAAVTGAFDDLTVWLPDTSVYPEFISEVGASTRYSLATALGSLLFVVENSLPTSSYIHLVYSDEPCCNFTIHKSFFAVSNVIDLKASYNDSGTIDLTAFGPEGCTVMIIGLPGEPPEDNYYLMAQAFSPAKGVLTAGDRHNGFLYTASLKGGGGQIFDVRYPSSGIEPPLVGTFNITGRVYSLEIVDTLCYLGSGRGLEIRQMEGPLVGGSVGTGVLGYEFYDVEFDWNDSLMFAALGDDGVGIFDVRDIAAPELLSVLQTPGFADGVVVRNGRVAVSDRYSALIYDYTLEKTNSQPILPTNYTLSQNYPNPFNSVTHIDFSVGGNANSRRPVELKIFNSLGETVATLVNGDIMPGVHHYTWDGRNSSGDMAASGVYFYRLTVDDSRSTKKMLLLK